MKTSRSAQAAAFTLVELLTVMVIIGILAGMVLGVAGFAQKKAASSRAEAEIQAMSAALESYKADNGAYPTPATVTLPTAAGAQASARALYQALSGDGGDALVSGTGASNGQVDSGKRQYMEFKPTMLGNLTTAKQVQSTVYVADPFGLPYGFYVWDESLNRISGMNPTFDLWCTVGTTAKKSTQTPAQWQQTWIKNW